MIDLVACPLCLQVRRGSEWVNAETAIRELRSYDHATPPTLHDRLCPECSEKISRRRSETAEPLAA